MFDLFTAIDEINKSIFRNKDSDSKKEFSSVSKPEKPTSNPPLKSAPRPTKNNNNDPFDFFSSLFNLCSGDRGSKSSPERKRSSEYLQEKKVQNEIAKQNMEIDLNSRNEMESQLPEQQQKNQNQSRREATRIYMEKLNSRMIEHGLDPIDTKKIMKSQLMEEPQNHIENQSIREDTRFYIKNLKLRMSICGIQPIDTDNRPSEGYKTKQDHPKPENAVERTETKRLEVCPSFFSL